MGGIKKILILFIFSNHFCYSDNGDTLKLVTLNPQTVFFNSEQFENSDSIKFIFNSLENFHNYLVPTHLGNSGMAINELRCQLLPSELGFFYSKNHFQHYFYTKKNLNFYDTYSPYSDLFYIIGSKKEQSFKATFSYNIKQNWNVTANFFRIRSDGFYLRQNTNDNFISLSSVYKSKKNRYNLLVGVMYNYVQNAENGGISNDSIFESEVGLDKKLLDINLSSAKRSLLNRNVFVNQYINMGLKSKNTDSNSTIIPSSRIALFSTFDDNLMKYEDGNPLSGFYSNIYNDSLQTFDSTYNLNFENELSWKRVDNTKHRGFIDKIGVGLNVKDQFIYIKQREIDTTFNNIIIGTELFNIYSDHAFWYKLSGKHAISGYNKGDYHINGLVKKRIFDSLTYVTLSVSSKLQMPDYIYNRYSSNHFKWDNEFDKILENSIDLSFLVKKYRLSIGVNYKEIVNPVYFDNFAIARQYKGLIPVASAFVKKDFTFLNWHFNNSILYQYVPDSTIIRLPEYILEHSLYYENDLFKKAMRLQIGASIYYVSNYFSNKYMPATGQFYLQDEKEYGNYPFINFFISAKIKEVRVFFKIDHLNSGWSGNKYQMTPDYPMNDRAFKLGISWRFYD